MDPEVTHIPGLGIVPGETDQSSSSWVLFRRHPFLNRTAAMMGKSTASSPKSSFLPESSLEDAWDEKGEETESQTARERRMPWAHHALALARRGAASLVPREPPQAGSASGESLPSNPHHK